VDTIKKLAGMTILQRRGGRKTIARAIREDALLRGDIVFKRGDHKAHASSSPSSTINHSEKEGGRGRREEEERRFSKNLYRYKSLGGGNWGEISLDSKQRAEIIVDRRGENIRGAGKNH